ncbi:MAG: hypothetical protein AAF497_12225 [Planctomycetota bacterium]
MKTERRHELQENVLADWLGKQIVLLKPYSTAIVAGFLIAAVLWFAVAQMGVNRSKNVSKSWDAYFEAAAVSDPENLREIAAQYPRTEAGAWARQSAGDLALATGSQNMFIDREKAKELLEEALDDYSAANSMATSDLLRQRSLLGIAQSNEALNNFEAAESAYDRVISGWPNSSIAKSSAKRLAFLKKPSTKEFYDWFMQQKPVVPQIPLGNTGGGSIKPPSVYDDLPSNPALELPSENALESPSGLGGPDINPPESSVETPPAPESNETP